MKSGAKRIPLNFIKIQLASPNQIRGWAERKLPNGKVVGEVKKTDTVHYNTMKPIKEGLFCEQIFGPVKDFECSCGIKSRKGLFCNECGVEFGTSQLRRYRLGYIELTSPVIHLWFLKGRTSILSELLDVPKRLLESTLYMRFSYWDTLTPKEVKNFQKEFLGTEKFFYWITNLSEKQNGTKVLKTQLENDTLLPEQLRVLYRITPTSFLYNGSLYEKSKTQPFSLAPQSLMPLSPFGPQKFPDSSQESKIEESLFFESNIERIEDSGFFLWKKKESAHSTFFAYPKQKKGEAPDFFYTKKKNQGSQRKIGVLGSYAIPQDPKGMKKKSFFSQKGVGGLKETSSLIHFLLSYRKSFRLAEKNEWVVMELETPRQLNTLLTQKVGVEFKKIFVWNKICTSFSITNIFFILNRINTFIAICTTNYNPFSCFYLEPKDQKELQGFQPQHPNYLGSEITFKRKGFDGHPLDRQGWPSNPWPSRGWPSNPRPSKGVSLSKPYNTKTKVQVLSIVNKALNFLVGKHQTESFDTKLFCNEAFSTFPKNFSDKKFLRVANPILKTSTSKRQKSKAFKTKSLSRSLLAKLDFFKLGGYSRSEYSVNHIKDFVNKEYPFAPIYSISSLREKKKVVELKGRQFDTGVTQTSQRSKVTENRKNDDFTNLIQCETIGESFFLKKNIKNTQKSFFLLDKKSTRTKKVSFLRGLEFWLKRREMSLKEFYTVTPFIWDIAQFPLQPFTSTTQIQGLIDNKFAHKTRFPYPPKNNIQNKVCLKQDPINSRGPSSLWDVEEQNVKINLTKHRLFSLLDEKDSPDWRKRSLTVFLTSKVSQDPQQNLLLFSFSHFEDLIFKRYRNSKFCYQNSDLKWGFFRLKSSRIDGINQRLRDNLYSLNSYFRNFISLSVISTTNYFSFSKKERGSGLKGAFIISFLKTKHNSVPTQTLIKPPPRWPGVRWPPLAIEGVAIEPLLWDIYPCDSYFWSFYDQHPSSLVQNIQSLLSFQNIAASFPKKFERLKLVNLKLIRNLNLLSDLDIPTLAENMHTSESRNPKTQNLYFEKGLSFGNIFHKAKVYSHELYSFSYLVCPLKTRLSPTSFIPQVWCYSQSESSRVKPHQQPHNPKPFRKKNWTLNSDWSAGYKGSTYHSVETLQFKFKDIQRRAVKYGNPKWLSNLSLFLKTKDTDSYSWQFFFKDSKTIPSKTDLSQEPFKGYNSSLIKDFDFDFFQRKKKSGIEHCPSSLWDVEGGNLQDYVLLTDVGTKGKALKSISFAYFGVRNLFAHLLTLDYATEFRESLDRIANLNHEIQSLQNEIQEEPLLEKELLTKIRKLLSQRSRRKRNAKALKAFKPSYATDVDISTQLKIRKDLGFGLFSSKKKHVVGKQSFPLEKKKVSGVQSLNKQLRTNQRIYTNQRLKNNLYSSNHRPNDENPLFSSSLFYGVNQRPFRTKQISGALFRETKKQKESVPMNAEAEWAILSYLPVLPPALRPILRLNGDQLVSSDLNKLYQKILFRNERLLRVENSSELDELNLDYAQVLLQEAVDTLIENGKGGSPPVCTETGRPYKSLSDTLKGKKGRFRQNLLGKRVDYSGRSVIVVGPKLKIYECGLPKEMGIELYLPFLIRYLLWTKKARTIVEAKIFLDKQMVLKNSIIWKILAQIMANHPVLLNRAPTLHRLGIQAFQPKLVEGRAILLHPLVCPAFNADFDGDQMAVHVPLSSQARAEAWNLLWSRNNILSPATGQPLLSPAQDMVLGCYFVTTREWKLQQGSGKWFGNLNDVLIAYNQKALALHSPVWVRSHQYIETGSQLQSPLEIRVSKKGWALELSLLHQRHSNFLKSHKVHFVRTTPGRILVNESIRRSIVLSHNLNRIDTDKVKKESKI